MVTNVVHITFLGSSLQICVTVLSLLYLKNANALKSVLNFCMADARGSIKNRKNGEASFVDFDYESG